MEQQFLAYFSRMKALSEVEKCAITDGIDIRHFPKGTTLFREGHLFPASYFVLSGCVRQFILKDGRETSTHFFTEEQWIITANMGDSDRASRYSLDCVEACTLVVGSESQGNQLLHKLPELRALSLMILEQTIAQQQTMMASFLMDTPTQRYLSLQTQRPDLLERVPQYQLASYIGILPESLSRIRKRLARQAGQARKLA